MDGDYVLPKEIEQSKYKTDFVDLVKQSFKNYFELYEELKKHKASEQEWGSKRDLEGAAKEDARYILPLCTKTQMGMTINARSFEILLRRLEAIPLAEAKELYQMLYDEVNGIAPSIVKYVKADGLPNGHLKLKLPIKISKTHFNEVTLINSPRYPDETILAGKLFEQQGGNFKDIVLQVGKLTKENKEKLWNSFFEGIKPWHKMPRVFEMVNFTFELTMSSSCYAQFKRHRMCTIIKAPYNAADGYVIPHSLKDTKQLKLYYEHLKDMELIADKLKSINPILYPYALTNAHRVRVLLKINLRELYHFVRLRSDEHAQWEVREISEAMSKIVKKHCLLSAQWLIGKSEF
jgi:thymidylate synthase ThyX